MENELNEDIIDSETNNETAVEDVQLEESQEEINQEPSAQETQGEKPQETPDAKRARLKRQLEQHEKKFGFRTEQKVEQKPIASDGLTSKDTIALINAKVHEDDIDDIVEYAKFKKVSVSEALKSGVIKSTLAEKQEQRNTANATNTGKTRSGNAKLSGEALLEKAQSTGDVPESDADMKALAEARLNSQRRK